MKRIFEVFVSSVIFFQFVTLSSAQTPMTAGSIIPPRGITQVSEETRMLIRKRLQQIEENRQAMLNRAKELDDQIEQRREHFREQLASIRDERKQAIVERLDERIQNLNDVWTRHAENVLTRLTKILAKVEVRADNLEDEQGADVSDVRTAIADTETAIEDAKTVVNEQSDKEYIFEIPDESNLGEAVSSTIENIHTDIKTMTESVTAARNTVQKAIKALAAI